MVTWIARTTRASVSPARWGKAVLIIDRARQQGILVEQCSLAGDCEQHFNRVRLENCRQPLIHQWQDQSLINGGSPISARVIPTILGQVILMLGSF
jgi:hypothetical protein